MTTRRFLIPMVLLLILLVCAGLFAVQMLAVPSAPVYRSIAAPAEMDAQSVQFSQDVANQTAGISAGILNVAGQLSRLSADDPQTATVLRAFFDTYADSSGVAWVDANGSVCTVPLYSIADILSSPEISQITQKSFENTDVLLIGPVYSNTYGMVLCFASAVYTPEGTYNGFICMPHIPALLLNDTPGTPYFKNTGYELWIINANGTYLYHPDAGFIGGNIYTSALFRNTPSVAEGVRAIAQHPEGAMMYPAYDLGATHIVEKTAVWRTVSFGGQEIRLVLDEYTPRAPTIVLPKNPDILGTAPLAESMLVYANKYGKERAVAEFNNPNGAFSKKGYEIFAYDTNGTVLAMPSDPQLTGEVRINYRDSYGMRTVYSFMNRCLQGGGYVHYYETVPYLDHQAIFGLAYVLPADGTWFIGAAGPAQNTLLSYNLSKRNGPVHTVEAAQKYVSKFGKEAALEMMMDPANLLASSSDHLWAMDYTGTVLADAEHPDVVGKNIFHFTDPHDASSIRELAMIARQGGGFAYVEYAGPNAGHNTISLAYTEPVNDQWCIVSSIDLDSYPNPGL